MKQAAGVNPHFHLYVQSAFGLRHGRGCGG